MEFLSLHFLSFQAPAVVAKMLQMPHKSVSEYVYPRVSVTECDCVHD